MAAAMVADGVELDVRRSSDGKLVLSHNADLAGLPVRDTPWSTLAEVDLGDGHHPALLDEVIAALPGTPIQLEVKNLPIDAGFEPDHRIALETADRARPGDMVTCFNTETLAAVRRTFPDVATGLIVNAPFALDEAVKQCLDAGHKALVPNHSLVTGPLSPEVEIYPWTVNDVPRARELAESGVTGIITDDPGRIAASLRSDP
jgi:glycerophosphoryl diester phosphodiesterase